jgi:hypothetical protein
MEPIPPPTSADSLVSPGIPTSAAGRTSRSEAPRRYGQIRLHSPSSAYEEAWCKGPPAQFPAHHPAARSIDCSTSTTPTSDYSFARSESFLAQLQCQYHSANESSLLQDGRNQSPQVTAECHLQIDPSIATHSPISPAFSPSTDEKIPSQQRSDWIGSNNASTHTIPWGPSFLPPQPPIQVSKLPLKNLQELPTDASGLTLRAVPLFCGNSWDQEIQADPAKA